MIYFTTPFKLFGRKFCNLASSPPHIAEMLQGIQSTESKQTIFLDSLCSIGIYVQKTPFYKKMLHIKDLKYMENHFCLKRIPVLE